MVNNYKYCSYRAILYRLRGNCIQCYPGKKNSTCTQYLYLKVLIYTIGENRKLYFLLKGYIRIQMLIYQSSIVLQARLCSTEIKIDKTK